MGTPVNISTLTNEVSMHLSGCPLPVIESAMRKTITELCQQAKVWEEDLPAITLVPATATYTMASALAYAEPCDVIRSHVVVGSVRQDLETLDNMQAYIRYPEPPAGTAVALVRGLGAVVTLVPIPDVAGTLHIRAALRPTPTATQWDSDLVAEFRPALFHGVLYDLMMMPERSWSDAKNAAFHGKMWAQAKASAGWRADTQYNRKSLMVAQRPFA